MSSPPPQRGRRLWPVLALALVMSGGVAALVTFTDGAADGDSAPSSRRGARATGAPPAASSRAATPPDANRSAAPSSWRALSLTAPWGAGPAAFGRKRAAESNPEAPMRLTVDRHGDLWVLDQVNRRLKVLSGDGRLSRTVAIGSETAQDLVVDADGRPLLLERHGDAAVSIRDAAGREVRRIPLAAADGAAASALLADDGGIYVELEHHRVLRVADARGEPLSPPEEIPGRPSRDGKRYLRAGLIDRAGGRAYVHAHDAQRQLLWERVLQLGGPVLHLLLLDSDLAGNTYLGAEVRDGGGGVLTVVARVGPSGQLTGQLTLPPTLVTGDETFRPLAVGDDGTIYQMVATATGLQLTSHRID